MGFEGRIFDYFLEVRRLSVNTTEAFVRELLLRSWDPPTFSSLRLLLGGLSIYFSITLPISSGLAILSLG
jgi:hypothetical protein